MTGKISILLAFLFLIIALVFGVRNYLYVEKSVKTEARVNKIEKRHRSINPTFEYTVNGKDYEIEGSNTNADAYKINDKEPVYYDPKKPEDARLGTFMNLWFMPVFCGGFFIILLVVGLGMVISKKSKPGFYIGGD
jgi:hypothetical protein